MLFRSPHHLDFTISLFLDLNKSVYLGLLKVASVFCKVSVKSFTCPVFSFFFFCLSTFPKTQFLIQECVSLISKPNFISTLCYAVDNPLHYQKVGDRWVHVGQYSHMQKPTNSSTFTNMHPIMNKFVLSN